MEDSLQHLLLLCCYGGQPFIDFHQDIQHQFTRQMDPTEWIATDTAGSLLDNSSLSIPRLDYVLSTGTVLSDCDLFNVTFLTPADQALFTSFKADLACRCPSGSSGASCESLSPSALSQVSSPPSESSMILVFAAILLALFAAVFMMVRGCLCDCFGPFSFSFSKGGEEAYDKPLDPRDVEKCLRKYREHEARQEMGGEQFSPLVATTSESRMPYNSTTMPSAPPPPMDPHYRAPSPPPSYSSVAGSTDRLPTSSL